jgi:hypothetical protein
LCCVVLLVKVFLSLQKALKDKIKQKFHAYRRSLPKSSPDFSKLRRSLSTKKVRTDFTKRIPKSKRSMSAANLGKMSLEKIVLPTNELKEKENLPKISSNRLDAVSFHRTDAANIQRPVAANIQRPDAANIQRPDAASSLCDDPEFIPPYRPHKPVNSLFGREHSQKLNDSNHRPNAASSLCDDPEIISSCQPPKQAKNLLFGDSNKSSANLSMSPLLLAAKSVSRITSISPQTNRSIQDISASNRSPLLKHKQINQNLLKKYITKPKPKPTEIEYDSQC